MPASRTLVGGAVRDRVGAITAAARAGETVRPVFAFGLALVIRRQRLGKRLDPAGWLAGIAGLAFLGSGVTVAWQMVLSLTQSAPDALAVATLFLAGLRILLGVLTLRLATRRSGCWTLPSRVHLALLGVIAPLVLAGWLAGPASQSSPQSFLGWVCRLGNGCGVVGRPGPRSRPRRGGPCRSHPTPLGMHGVLA